MKLVMRSLGVGAGLFAASIGVGSADSSFGVSAAGPAAFSDSSLHGPFNERPWWLKSPRSTDYDGVSDDLLTAGLGKSGLASVVPPPYVDAAHPTAPELRREFGLTIVMATHSEEAAERCDERVTLSDGRIVSAPFGPP